jgi:hypothetical protein
LFRDTALTSVQIRGGLSIRVLQALLGHKSTVETWDTDDHLMGDEDDRGRAVIDMALGGGPRLSAAATPTNGDGRGRRQPSDELKTLPQ